MLRRLAADLLRCVFPEARHWKALPAPETEPMVLTPLARLGRGWGDAALLAAAALEDGDAAAAGDAAVRLSEVTEAARWVLLSAVFAETAALASRNDPKRALRVATLARDRADYVAAEWWGCRAGHLAYREREWKTAVYGWARVADARAARGDHDSALHARHREYRAAQRTGSVDLQVRAAHSLLFAFYFAGKGDLALRLAPDLVRLYPSDHPQLPKLAHDSAWLQLEQGDAAAALPTLRALITRIPREESLQLAISHARAAAASGEWAESKRMETEALALLASNGYTDAWAMAALARLAASRGDVETARTRAHAACHVAARTREDAAAVEAHSVLTSLSNQCPPPMTGPPRFAPDEAAG